MSRGVDGWVATGAARRRIGPFFKMPKGGTDIPRNILEERRTQLRNLFS
jgi:hypothetical protein